MKLWKLLCSVIIISFLLISCSNNTLDTAKEKEAETSEIEDIVWSPIELLNLTEFNWTNDEILYIKELNKKGYIKIATKINSTVYFPLDDGTILGFHYNIIEEFAKLAGIKVDLQLVEWNDYFYKEGADLEKVKSDLNYSYVPTLIEDVDLYIDGITSLPWREKMFDIIKFVPSKQMIITRKDDVLLSLSDLNNKTYSMVKDTSMEQNMDIIINDNALETTCFYVEDFDLMVQKVIDGEVYFTVVDSDATYRVINENDNITVAMPISEIQIMGWGIHKEDQILNSILYKYLEYAQNNQILDYYWKDAYGMTFINYLKILQLD